MSGWPPNTYDVASDASIALRVAASALPDVAIDFAFSRSAIACGYFCALAYAAPRMNSVLTFCCSASALSESAIA